MNQQIPRILSLTCVLLLVWPLSGNAIPVASINVKHLIDESDLVVVGKVGSFAKTGEVSVTMGAERSSANLLESSVEILQVLKGSESDPSIQVAVPVLQPPSGSVALDGIPANSVRLLFLKSVGPHQYKVVDPHHPSLPATGSNVSGPSLTDTVAAVECGVMRSGEMSQTSRLESIWSLRGVEATCIIPGLRALTSTHTPVLTLTAEQALMQRGDIETLPSAISDALSTTDNEPDYLKSNVLYAIGNGMHNAAAIKMLDPLLKSEKSDAHLAAARALKNIGTVDCVPVLRTLVADANQDVRYQAVIGLADITGTPRMHPSIPEFKVNESKYTAQWR